MDSEALKQAVESLDGDFELIREIGRGATAVVYLLRDHDLERDVAMKIIRRGLGSAEEGAARLQREAHLVARLHHPNIVKLFSTHQLRDGGLVLLMEHVPGLNLKELLVKSGPQEIPFVLEVMKDVASALAYAHRRRIVHRDVKPENIYIDEEVGAARLADFGVARPWDQDSRLTLPGASLGTPAYMSPEQIDGKQVDGRSDVYSLGLVGYEMILGEHPWEGENVFTMIFKQKREFLSMDLPGLDRYPALPGILEKCLAKDPADRWESAAVLLAALRDVRPSRRRSDPDTLFAEPRRKGGEETELPTSTPDTEGKSSLSPEPGEAASPSLQSALADEEALPTPMEPAPVVVRRGRRSLAFWATVVLALAVGSFAFYRIFLAPSGPAEFEVAPPTATNPPVQPQLQPGVGLEEEAAPTNPLSILVPDGGEVEGRVGTLVTLTAQIVDAGGRPVADTVVNFRLVEGEGTLETESVRTGDDGEASVNLRLPVQAGLTRVGTSVEGGPSSGNDFRVRAVPGPPAVVTPILGDGQRAFADSLLPEFIGVRVLDEFGNPVPETPVRFRVVGGGGRIGPADSSTDGVGRAFSRWWLGPNPGAQTLAVMIPGLEDSGITFRATALDVSPVEEESPAAAPSPRPVEVQVREHPFAIGGSFVCQIRGGDANCRGLLGSGRPEDGPDNGFQALATGVSHACGLNGGGSASCWGANESGQLGDGTTIDRESQVAVASDVPFTLLVGGLSHTCGLSGQGRAFCWGRNLNGQLGDRSRTDRGSPGPAAGSTTFLNLVAGWNHTCGLTGEGRAFCWGLNGDGQVGDGTAIDRLVPTRVPGQFRSLAAGASHTCGITEEGVSCWGSNAFGQLGTGEVGGTRASPVPVSDLPAVPVALTAGAVHTCALLEGGEAYCWGQNLHGQLGDGTTDNSPVPVPVLGGHRFARIFAGGADTCGFTAQGEEYCWGFNQGGQLGDGSRTNRSEPVRIGG